MIVPTHKNRRGADLHPIERTDGQTSSAHNAEDGVSKFFCPSQSSSPVQNTKNYRIHDAKREHDSAIRHKLRPARRISDATRPDVRILSTSAVRTSTVGARA
jgi:hypothetical protein